ncbi:ankyrin repeat domain-containing protein [Phytophthora cinnamomi]|uniref:ankyrin repeat domain-containing protein n=1 Tax=Phytophthora cinnamomi TaxID=4785 RepID=UPI0035595209|nr:ankyrin repeat domain-containing protein [Phytophthora cinnamomi]
MGNAHKPMRAVSTVESELPLVDQDVNATNAYGYTLLLFAARDGDVKAARFLLEHHAAVDTRNGYGATALHFAASWGQLEVARLLLEHGASVNVVDRSGKTPLLRAAANGDVKLVRLLLKHGADMKIRDAFGWNAERFAANAGHYKVLATLRHYEVWSSCSSDDGQRWSQRSSGVLSAITQRFSSSSDCDAKKPKVDVPFPTSVDQPASQHGSNALKPLRPHPCLYGAR